MAFNYGKKTLNIPNPFKTEGKLDLTYGSITLLLGIIQAFLIRSSINSGFQKIAWIELIFALFLLSYGLRTIIVGSMRLFKFLVGREIPSNLSPSPYPEKSIEKILMNRTNPTFIEKNDFVSRLLISIYEKFLFLPIGFRNLLESVSSILFSFLIFLVIYLLTIFSTSIGLIKLTDKNSLIGLFGLVFLIKQFAEWVFYFPNKKRLSKLKSGSHSNTNIIINIVIAIFIPVILEMYLTNGGGLINVDVNVFLPIFLLFLFSVVLLVVTYFLCMERLEHMNPDTSVSEYKEHIQVSSHPKDVFRCFEIEMANKRYKELPNRIYKEIKPVLELEGSNNKGSFKGSTIQETQPIHEELNLSERFKNIRFFTALTGRIFMIISFIYLLISIKLLTQDASINNVVNIFYYPILTSLFGYYLIRISHVFYSEVLFSSFLVHFFSEGTYAESKVSSGMSVYDSTRSENTIVNTSATPWILVSKIITSTLADSSTKNLEGKRYILEMNKGDDFLNDLVNGFTNYLKNKKLIVGLNSKMDIDNSLDFHKLNEMTRGNKPSNDKIEEHKERNAED